MPLLKLALLVEVFVGRQHIGPENAEPISMELIGARLGHQADHACAAALIRGWRVLGFNACLFHAVFGNIERGNNGGDVVFRDTQSGCRRPCSRPIPRSRR